MKAFLMIGAATATSLWMAPANAAPKNDPWPTQEVRYNDLDLTQISDQIRLKHRLANSASALCKEVDNAMPVAPTDPVCYRMTLQAAVRQMDVAVARAKGGPTLAAETAASPSR